MADSQERRHDSSAIVGVCFCFLFFGSKEGPMDVTGNYLMRGERMGEKFKTE